MITLPNIAEKLQELLNSIDGFNFQFVVKSQGYHLDAIASQKTGKNAIPVFVSMVNGENNPVPNLKQKNLTYEINIYYPVRFKEDFYNLNDYLDDMFVAKKVQFGTELALCNMSVAEYGEIVDVQLEQFENWLETEYSGAVKVFKKEEEINEPYMSMTFRLYATTLGNGFIFGNDIKYNLSITIPKLIVKKFRVKYDNKYYLLTRDSTKDIANSNKYAYYGTFATVPLTLYIDSETYISDLTKFYTYDSENQTFVENVDVVNLKSMEYDKAVGNNTETIVEEMVWSNSGTGVAITPASEQLIGIDKFARNTPNITNYNKSLVGYVKDNEFWSKVLYCYNSQDLDISSCVLTKVYEGENHKMQFELNQIILSINENIALGEPLTFTLTLGD